MEHVREQVLITRIYGLVDPRNQELRYVGKTKNKVEARYWRHLNDDNNNYCSNWIKGLKEAGYKPEVFVIEIIFGNTWIEAETFWIAYFRSLGCRLTNLTNGGEGIPGHKDSEQTRLKKSQAMKGKKKSLEHIAKMNLFKPGHN